MIIRNLGIWLNNEIKQSKNSYYHSHIETNRGNPKALWRTINQVIIVFMNKSMFMVYQCAFWSIYTGIQSYIRLYSEIECNHRIHFLFAFDFV